MRKDVLNESGVNLMWTKMRPYRFYYPNTIVLTTDSELIHFNSLVEDRKYPKGISLGYEITLPSRFGGKADITVDRQEVGAWKSHFSSKNFKEEQPNS